MLVSGLGLGLRAGKQRAWPHYINQHEHSSGAAGARAGLYHSASSSKCLVMWCWARGYTHLWRSHPPWVVACVL